VSDETFSDTTEFVATIIHHWPEASDADIAALRDYASAVERLLRSPSFPGKQQAAAFVAGMLIEGGRVLLLADWDE
jgi:hypothetical protein